jgi:hypothetical protein
MSSKLGPAWRIIAVLLSTPGVGAAQQRIFPDVPSFFGQELEAEVALGENFPVVAIRGGANPITFGLGSQVYARFSLHDKKSALISNDWVVGVNRTAELGVGLQASPGSREIGLAIIAHDGLSTQRQFFQNESRYVGVEVRFDL